MGGKGEINAGYALWLINETLINDFMPINVL